MIATTRRRAVRTDQRAPYAAAVRRDYVVADVA